MGKLQLCLLVGFILSPKKSQLYAAVVDSVAGCSSVVYGIERHNGWHCFYSCRTIRLDGPTRFIGQDMPNILRMLHMFHSADTHVHSQVIVGVVYSR